MRLGLVSSKCLAHILQCETKNASGGHCGHEVLCIVCSLEPAILKVQQWTSPSGHPADHQTTVKKQIGIIIVGTEGYHLARWLKPEFPELLKGPRLYDRPVKRALVHKNARLGLDVVLHRVIAIEVIWRKVGKHGDSGAKLINGVQLEGTNLQRQYVKLACVGHDLTDWRADVAGGLRLALAVAKQVSNQFSGGGLAVGSGYSNAQAKRIPPAQL